MVKVKDYEEISKLIFKNLKKDVLTNCFLSKEELEKEIEAGTLYYVLVDDGILIIRNRENHYIINYYINAKNDYVELKQILNKELDKIAVLEVVGKSIDDEKYIKACDVFGAIGFNKEFERERFIKNKVDISAKNSDTNKILVCDANDIDNVMAILKESFSEYFGCIPTKKELENEIQNVYKVLENDEIAGIIHIKKEKKGLEIRHLTVREDYRKRGIASSLVAECEKDIEIVKKTVWTGKDNIAAQKTYRKAGYQKDGYVSSIFTKRKKDDII